MDLDGYEVQEQGILKRVIGSTADVHVEEAEERCEVIVSEQQTFEIKFHKSNEVLTIKFHYGYWNKSGVAQH
jgi:hypothetical protein